MFSFILLFTSFVHSQETDDGYYSVLGADSGLQGLISSYNELTDSAEMSSLYAEITSSAEAITQGGAGYIVSMEQDTPDSTNAYGYQSEGNSNVPTATLISSQLISEGGADTAETALETVVISNGQDGQDGTVIQGSFPPSLTSGSLNDTAVATPGNEYTQAPVAEISSETNAFGDVTINNGKVVLPSIAFIFAATIILL